MGADEAAGGYVSTAASFGDLTASSGGDSAAGPSIGPRATLTPLAKAWSLLSAAPVSLLQSGGTSASCVQHRRPMSHHHDATLSTSTSTCTTAKRHVASDDARTGASYVHGETVAAAGSRPPAVSSSTPVCWESDEGAVDALLPKMKRMRLRPSLGQLRLQREAEDEALLSMASSREVRVFVQPEQLRAIMRIAGNHNILHYASAVHLELIFPPQYPHRPPKVVQIAPEERLPCWRYDGRCIMLSRLADHGWSSVLGVADIVRDLVEGEPELVVLQRQGDAPIDTAVDSSVSDRCGGKDKCGDGCLETITVPADIHDDVEMMS